MEIFHKAFFVTINSIFLSIISFYIIILDTKYLGVVIYDYVKHDQKALFL